MVPSGIPRSSSASATPIVRRTKVERRGVMASGKTVSLAETTTALWPGSSPSAEKEMEREIVVSRVSTSLLIGGSG